MCLLNISLSLSMTCITCPCTLQSKLATDMTHDRTGVQKRQNRYLTDSTLALTAKGETKAGLGVAPLLDRHPQQLQVVDGVHVHVCEVR